MSIYVAIPTEHDPEIFYTVRDAVLNSEFPADIHIGVACMTNIDFYNKVKEEMSVYTNVDVKYFDVNEPNNIGVGAGRQNALSMYNNEKYILQIDSHTMLLKGWDTFLIKLFNEALKETKNKKTILTSYLPEYVHTEKDGRSGKANVMASYSFFRKNEYFWGTEKNVPRWDLKYLVESRFDKKIFKKIKNKKFLPAQKINAQFVFTTNDFYKDSGLPRNIFFYEEEIVQSINLYENGYSFVWPNMLLPLRHLYGCDSDSPGSLAVRSRGCDVELWKSLYYKLGDIYFNFIEDEKNIDKCKKYEDYAGINLKTGSLNEDIIPLRYRVNNKRMWK